MSQREITDPASPDNSAVAVTALMSRSPIVIEPRAQAHVAERLARSSGVHHLPVVEGGKLLRVVCLCDLDHAAPSDLIGSLGNQSVVVINASARASEAAHMMLECGVGCLPVLDDAGALVGIITRRDLRRGGFLPGERGVDLCAACGSGHHLRNRATDAAAFCVSCLASTPIADSAEFRFYYTLGGSE